MHPLVSAGVFVAASLVLVHAAHTLASQVVAVFGFFVALWALLFSEHSRFVFDFATRRIFWSRWLFFHRSSGTAPLSRATRALFKTEERGRYRRAVYVVYVVSETERIPVRWLGHGSATKAEQLAASINHMLASHEPAY